MSPAPAPGSGNETNPDPAFNRQRRPCSGGLPRGAAHDRASARKTILGGLLASILIGAQIFAVSAAARVFSIPADQPFASVEIPDSWRPTLAPNGVEASALDGAVHLAVESIAASDLDEASATAIKRLAERKVSVEPETKRTATRRFNGFDALKIDFSGTDPSGESDITVLLIAAPSKSGFVSISYWGEDEAQESVSNDLQSIADSLVVTN